MGKRKGEPEEQAQNTKKVKEEAQKQTKKPQEEKDKKEEKREKKPVQEEKDAKKSEQLKEKKEGKDGIQKQEKQEGNKKKEEKEKTEKKPVQEDKNAKKPNELKEQKDKKEEKDNKDRKDIKDGKEKTEKEKKAKKEQKQEKEKEVKGSSKGESLEKQSNKKTVKVEENTTKTDKEKNLKKGEKATGKASKASKEEKGKGKKEGKGDKTVKKGENKPVELAKVEESEGQEDAIEDSGPEGTLNLTNKKLTPADGLVYEFSHNWYCYWDDSFGMPVDPQKDYVFKHPLTLWGCGIVHLDIQFPKISADTLDEKLKADLESLLRLKEIVKGLTLGSETDYRFYPIIVQYKSQALTINQALKALYVHPTIREAVKEYPLQQHLEKDEKDPKTYSGIFEWQKEVLNNKIVSFAAGEDKLNPVVWGSVGIGKSGNLIGLLSGLVWT